MICPICGGKTKVVMTRSSVDEIIRVRKCCDCKKRFFTSERDIEYSYGLAWLRNYERERKLRND